MVLAAALIARCGRLCLTFGCRCLLGVAKPRLTRQICSNGDYEAEKDLNGPAKNRILQWSMVIVGLWGLS